MKPTKRDLILDVHNRHVSLFADTCKCGNKCSGVRVVGRGLDRSHHVGSVADVDALVKVAADNLAAGMPPHHVPKNDDVPDPAVIAYITRNWPK